MEADQIIKSWEEFKRDYPYDKKSKIWEEKSVIFKTFWEERLLNENIKKLEEEEIDEIIMILDRNAKGNTRENEAVARAMIAQGAWRRMFQEIKENKELRETLYSILKEEEDEKLIGQINKFYKLNEGKKNFLTGKSGNAINIMLFAYNPKKYVSVISLNHRQKIIDYFGFKGPDFEKDSQGLKMIKSNKAIIEGFKIFGIDVMPRAISDFLYLKIKTFWDKGAELESEEDTIDELPEEKIEYLEEKYYQKLIHRNFKKIFPNFEYFDPEYQNIHEGHYDSEAGTMDFLCKDKKGDFVVIELKIVSSDKALGQICRYMGYVKENLCDDNQKVKGIIISENNDLQLDYAIKVVPNITFKKMRLDVKIVD